MLDVLTPGELMGAAQRGDTAALARASGVGPKLALRIVTELKDKPIGGAAVAAFHGQAAPSPARDDSRRSSPVRPAPHP